MSTQKLSPETVPARLPDLSILSHGAHSDSAYNAASTVPVPATRWKTRVLLPAVILLSFAGVLGYALRDAILPATTVRTVPVVVKMAAGGDASGVVAQAAGWVEPDPYPIYVSALADGIVKEVLVLEGQRIKAGDVVARLIDEDAKLDLEFAEAELHHHEHDICEYTANVKAAQAEWDHPTERNRAIKAGEAMLAQSRADLAANAFDVALESAKLKELEDQYRRENLAADSKAISEGQRVQTGLKLETQRAALKVAEAKRPALEAKLAQQQADLVAAQENLRLRIQEGRAVDETNAKLAAERHTVETVRVKRDQAKLRVKRMEVRSPADGVVMERMTEPGAKLYVNMNERNSSQAAKLYDPKKLQVRVDVPLIDASKVGAGQRARITVEVLRDIVFEGEVTRVSHQADIQKNTLQVKVAIKDPRDELRPEMLARVQFLAIEKTDGKSKEPSQRLFARENLIRVANGSATAWIVDKGKNVAIRRTVVLGTIKQDGWIEVLSGLNPGDAVIDEDTTRFVEGQRVKLEEAAAPANEPATTPAPSTEHKH
ncbi:MAG: efflux RND transporter periplasmic adaptor subunit [Planctomycetota bacterium]